MSDPTEPSDDACPTPCEARFHNCLRRTPTGRVAVRRVCRDECRGGRPPSAA